MKAKYCKCKNTYTINNCDKTSCSAMYYWSQGMGCEGTDTATYLTDEIGRFITAEDGIKITV